MTIQTRAIISRDTEGWTAIAFAYDDQAGPFAPRQQLDGKAESWPEAMQLAQVLLADLDAQLMDEIHADRTNRRYTQPQEETP